MTNDIPPVPDKATLTSTHRVVATLKRWLEEGDRLTINKRYQRGKVGAYKPEFATRLIESVIRGFPIPPLILMKNKDNGKLEIIDGQQRLTTICDYMDNRFKLDGRYLMVLNEDYYHGKRYSDLDSKHKDRIQESDLNVNEIDDTMEAWQVYVLINGGMNPLTIQELRKARYADHDRYWEMDELVNHPDWQEKIPSSYRKREKDSELYHKGFVAYLFGDDLALKNLGTAKWIEAGLERLMKYDENKMETKLKRFTKVLTTVGNLFDESGKTPFRRNNVFTGKWSNFSSTYVPPVCYAVGKLVDKYAFTKIMSKKSELVGAFDYYMSVNDNGTEKDVAGAQPSKFIPTSVELWDVLQNVMADLHPKMRSSEHYISQELRKQVIEAHTNEDKKVICGICDQPISDGGVDIDHIVEVENDGKTTLENLRPSHVACNRGRI